MGGFPAVMHDFGNLHDLALGDLFVNCYVPRAPIIYHHGASILAQISKHNDGKHRF